MAILRIGPMQTSARKIFLATSRQPLADSSVIIFERVKKREKIGNWPLWLTGVKYTKFSPMVGVDAHPVTKW